MPIDDPMVAVVENGQREAWVTPSIILGALDDAEGGPDPLFTEATDPAGGS